LFKDEKKGKLKVKGSLKTLFFIAKEKVLDLLSTIVDMLILIINCCVYRPNDNKYLLYNDLRLCLLFLSRSSYRRESSVLGHISNINLYEL
jgi:hypothetical protein